MPDNALPPDSPPIPESVQARMLELEKLLEDRQAELTRTRAENVKARVLLESRERLPAAYQAQVAASENEEEVRTSLQEVTERFKTDLRTFGRPANPLGAPPAGVSAAAPPRWHGKKPSEIPPQDWPAYKKQVLGLR